ncbi:MAG: hypothetical protein JJ891_16780 [Rhizobiaceae bacterium]|nr:hypothetical protein [Rhizobiaceae bacterium]
MVAKTAIFRPSMNAGEFGELLDPRLDIREYYSACRRMRGAEPIPQSGFRKLPGSRQIGRGRNQMAQVSAADSGGTGPHSVFPVVLETAVFAETAINAVSIDTLDVDADVTGTFKVQVETGGNWTDFGSEFSLAIGDNNRVAMLSPGQSILATGARLVASADGPFSTTTAIAVHAETSSIPEAIVYEDYSFSQAETFCLSLTPGWCDVWRDNLHKGGFRHPFTAGQLPLVKFYSEGNTFGMFHEDVESRRAFRIGGVDHEWRFDLWPYEEIGLTNYGRNADGSEYTRVDDVWTIFVRFASVDDLILNVIINGEETGGVALGVAPGSATSTEWDDFADAIKAAIEGLPSIKTGISITNQAAAGTRQFVITFGGGNSGTEYEFASQIVNTSEASALAAHTTVGETIGEPAISDDRGWPGTVELAQDRLIYGALKSRPAGMLFSENGEYFNLDIEQQADDAPFFRAIRVDSQETIRHIVYSRYLLIFTDQGEYFANDREINRNKPLNFVNASEFGSSAVARPQDVEGLLFYVNEDGNVLYVASYDDVRTSYESDPASTFADHIFKGIIRSARKKPDDQISAHRLYYLRDNGELLQLMVMKSQNINAFSVWETPGDTKAVCVDRQETVHVAVKRQDANGDFISHEVWDRTVLLHGETSAGPTDLAGMLTVPASYEGMKVWVVADGLSLGEHTVTNGQIDLEFAYTDCRIGWWKAPHVEPMPFVRLLPNDQIVRRPGRIHTFRGKLKDTSSIAIGANGETPRDIPLVKAGDVAGVAPMWNGVREVTGLGGMMVDTTLVITQTKPGFLEVRDLVVEAKL